jgi:heat shock protein HslJ
MKRTLIKAGLTITITTLFCLSALGMDADSSTQRNDLVGTKWNWIGTQMRDTRTTVENPLRYNLDFTTDSKVLMKADCNTANGGYSIQGRNIRFTPFAMTRMACAPGSLGSLFAQNVQTARKYRRVGDNSLVLELASGATLTFAQALSPSVGLGLEGTKWNWLGTQTGTEKVVATTPIKYSLDFRTANTVYVRADCNTGSGSYKLDGDHITFGPMAMTMMACPPGSQDLQFKQAIGAANTYKIVIDHMIFVGNDGSATLFARAATSASARE